MGAAGRAAGPGRDDLARAVARYDFKLMAIKDEYEVARLYADGSFERKLREQFEGDFKLRFHLAPPSFAPRDPQTGQLKKLTFGPWMLPAFRAMAALKGLRGGRFDVFGRSDERKIGRRLRDEIGRASGGGRWWHDVLLPGGIDPFKKNNVADNR